MELTKHDSKEAKGIAILGMVMLHLFCRLGDLPYTPLVWVGSTPLIYYLGLFGDICVPTYCLLSGYAQSLLTESEGKNYTKKRYMRIFKFLINYWIVLCLFSVLGLVFDGGSSIPVSAGAFAGNFFLYALSFNGAWWFVLTYVLLVLAAPVIIKVANKCNTLIVFFAGGAIYFAAYLFRFSYAVDLANPVLAFLWTQLLLFGTSQFPFVLGVLFRKHKLVSKVRAVKIASALKNALCAAAVLGVFVFHCVFQSLIVAPITAVVSLLCYWACSKPKFITRGFRFLGEHSTNIWLVHMFFYLTLFRNLVFLAEYPLLILFFMLVLCIASSFIIQLPYKFILKRMSK